MKVSKKAICIFLLMFFGFLILNIMDAKINGLYSGFNPQGTNYKIVSWEEVLKEWRLILYYTIVFVLVSYLIIFLARKKK